MQHKEKVKMARKMSKTKKECLKKESIFTTDEWERRREAKLNKQLNQGKKKK